MRVQHTILSKIVRSINQGLRSDINGSDRNEARHKKEKNKDRERKGGTRKTDDTGDEP